MVDKRNHTPYQSILHVEHRKITKIYLMETKGKLFCFIIYGLLEFMLSIQPMSIVSNFGLMVELDI